MLILNLFIGHVDGKMDGNHSLLPLASHLFHCADVQAPLIINIILGLPANVCVMCLIVAGPGNKAAEILSLNQAICEVAICMANVISLIAINITISNVTILTYFLFAVKFTLGFIFSGRPLFMSCICLERYLAVVHPVTFLKYKLLRYRLVQTIISWLTVMVCCTVLIWVPYSSIYYVSFVMAFTCFLVQLFCCVETLCALVRPGPGKEKRESNAINGAKLKAFKIIMITIVASTLHYPLFVFSLILHGHLSLEVISKLFCSATYIAMITGFIPPILYIYNSGKLQHCIRGTP